MSKKQISFFDSNIDRHDFIITTPDYGVCNTVANDENKIVTCDEFSLFTGASITVNFKYAPTTDTISLNVNDSGLIAVDFNSDNCIAKDEIKANGCYDFVYNGTNWLYKGSNANKVDKVEGKGLSTNDYDDAEKAEVANIKNKVDKVEGKSLVDATDIRTAIQNGNLYFEDGKEMSLQCTENGVTGTNVIDAASMTVEYNNMKTAIGCSTARFSFTDTNKNVFIQPENVTINQGGKTVHALSSKANTSDVFLKSDDIVLADGKKISADVIEGDTLSLTGNITTGIMGGDEGNITTLNGDIKTSCGDVIATEMLSADGSIPEIIHKLSKKANTADVILKSDKTIELPVSDAQISLGEDSSYATIITSGEVTVLNADSNGYHHKLSKKANTSDLTGIKGNNDTSDIFNDVDNNISGAKVFKITAVNRSSSGTNLTVDLSSLGATGKSEFPAAGDKCYVRTSMEFDNLTITAIDFDNSIITVDGQIHDLDTDDYCNNYIGFIESPNFEYGTITDKTKFAHVEGETNVAYGRASHAEGRQTKAIGQYSHAEGRQTESGPGSHAEGRKTKAYGDYSHAEGYMSESSGYCSHAEGYQTKATIDYSHAEGYQTEASGYNSHAEGRNSIASGETSHAEGYQTEASGYNSHAEGQNTIASQTDSHAEGYLTEANGYTSHAEGLGAKASSKAQHVQGMFNIIDSNDKYAHIVGNGTSDTARSNAHTVDWGGNAWFAGDVELLSGKGFYINKNAYSGTTTELTDSGLTIKSNDAGGTQKIAVSGPMAEISVINENGLFKLSDLANKTEAKVYTVNVPTTDWVTATNINDETYYYKRITVSSMTTSGQPITDVEYSTSTGTAGVDVSNWKHELAAYQCVSNVVTGSGYVDIYCFDELPTVSFNMKILVFSNVQ